MNTDPLVGWTQLVGSLSDDVRIPNLRQNLFDRANFEVLANLDLDALIATSVCAIEIQIFVGRDSVSERRRIVRRPTGLPFVERFNILPNQLTYKGKERFGFKNIGNLRIEAKIEFDQGIPNHLSNDTIRIFIENLSKKIVTSAYNSIYEILDKGVNSIRAQLRSRNALNQLPGTIVAKTLQLVGRYGGSLVTCYCTMFGRELAIEYVHRNRGKASFKFGRYSYSGQNIFISQDLLERLEASNSAVVEPHDLVNYSAMIDQLKRLAVEDAALLDDRGRLVLTRIIWRGTLTGLLLQYYPIASAAIAEKASSIAESAAAAYSESSRWLFQRRFKRMLVNPLFQSRDTRIVDHQAFIVMPFNEPWSAEVETSVREILINHGYKSIRADDMFGANLMEDIWKGICQSEIVIVDTTGRNPNVYYELGICHSLGKEVIKMTQSVTDIPFDIRHLRHVVYENSLSGVRKLRSGIEGHLQDHAKRVRPPGSTP